MDTHGEQAIADAIMAAWPNIELIGFATPPARHFSLAGAFAGVVEATSPYWIVVSRGCTELDDKQEQNPDVSGWGFELTCRVPATTRVPERDIAWVLSWMQGLVDYMAEGRVALAPLHHTEILEPAHDDDKCALAFVDDVALRGSQTRNGRFDFLQMVALTRAEHQALQSWDCRRFLDLIRRTDPLLTSDPNRSSYLRDRDFAAQVDAGRERDGSSTGILHGPALLWFEGQELTVHLPVATVPTLLFSLRHRLRHGNMMMLMGARRPMTAADGTQVEHAQTNIVLLPEAGASRVEERGGMKAAAIRLVPEAVTDLLETIVEQPGSYQSSALPGVRFVVTPDERFADERYPW